MFYCSQIIVDSISTATKSVSLGHTNRTDKNRFISGLLNTRFDCGLSDDRAMVNHSAWGGVTAECLGQRSH